MSLNCRIHIHEPLEPHWSDWFDGLVIEAESNGSTLRGTLPDHAAVYGLLLKLRDLNLSLAAVEVTEVSQP